MDAAHDDRRRQEATQHRRLESSGAPLAKSRVEWQNPSVGPEHQGISGCGGGVVVRKRFVFVRIALAIFLTILAMALTADAMAAGCPSEPDWSYTGDNGPTFWNQLFPIMCGQGSLQSPFAIDTTKGNVISAKLPKLTFHYDVAHVIFLDHDDQIEVDHGQGNFITIGSTEYDLVNVHVHTPSEHTINGKQFPMEIQLVHQSADGMFAVVGVLVTPGKKNDGVIGTPSTVDPSTVELDMTKLIPKDKKYVQFTGSLTTPGSTTALPRCEEGPLWTVMLTPITMSQDQIAAFEDSEQGCWGTTITNRPLQPIGNRPVLISK
jgi:carbonic anhydrase